jgi:hypothetical protein
MLYIKTVQCKVFRLYSNGSKLPEAVRGHTPAVGRLIYSARLKHEQIRLTVFTAQLLALDNDRCIIPVLDTAILMRISDRGMLLSGQEIIARGNSRNSRTDYYRQAWVIRPIAGG